jgi:hypothetical protein
MAFIYNVTIDSKEKDNCCRITWQKQGTGSGKSYGEPGKTFHEIEKLRGQWFLRKSRKDVGRKLFRFLDGKERLFLNALEEAKRQGEILQVNLYTCDAVSRWPFELLVYGNRFYVPYDLHLVRCASHSTNQGSITPHDRPLELLFMTGPGHNSEPVPPGEGEGKVISQVKKFQGIVTTIEDSGTLTGLCGRLKTKPHDVLYLTGKFDIDEIGLPYLIMNGPDGREENHSRVYPGDLWDDALRENPPLLLFMTSFYSGAAEPAMENLAASFFGQQLTEHYHLPAVLAWNPPARDPWVNAAEISFFRELGRGETILDAVHRIRIELYQTTSNRESILWALLQLYGSGITLNAIVDKDRKKQPVSLRDDSKENNRHRTVRQGDSPKDFNTHRQSLQMEIPAPAIPVSNMNMSHDVHGLPLPNGPGALSKIRQLSQIAFRDAGFVSESPHSKDGPDIRLERNLYVVRTIEKDIHKFLDDCPPDESSLLLIFGEAGSGKTSLLWHFFHSFSQPENASREPWFIKSSILYTSIDHAGTPSASDFQLTLSELSAAAAEVNRQGKQAVILLDTVDLLLHSEKHREYIMVVLRTLEEYGCRIIAASRPQEANHLFSQADYKKLLGEYEGEELEKAIAAHVRCFYGRAHARDMKEHIETILNAVSNGLQIREVCLNPLTLRMLFTLYAPQDIPKEINTFELYCNYWEMRVVKDHRAGSSYSTREDLGEVAAVLSLAMLAEGAPELRKMVQEQRFRQQMEISSQLEKLESRRIIQQSEDKTIRFFHQTFFEHCAARGLLMKYRRQVILLLKNRTEANPNDLFVSPVMEQVLLLIENETQSLRKQGDGFLLYLLQSNHQLLKCSGLYVYVHRKETGHSLRAEVQHILSDSEYATVNHFLKLAPNMPQVGHRFRILFQELDIAWSRDSMDARDIILELLERFSSRFPGYVEDFLKNHDILDFSPDLWKLGFKSIINIMEILVIHSPPGAQHALIEKLLRVLEQKISDVLTIRIMETLQRLSANLNATDTATRCEQAMKVLEDKDDQKHSIPLGRLFYIQWKNANTPVQKILAELPFSRGFALKARLRGLYRGLLTAGRQEASLAWEHFIAETDSNKRWLWAHLVIPNMINGYPVAHDNSNENRETETGSSGTSPSILFFREKVKALFTRWSIRSPGDEGDSKDLAAEVDTFQNIRKAVALANPRKEILLDLLSAPTLEHSSQWLSPQLFGELLPHGYNAGNSGAVEAMQRLVSRPDEYPRKLINMTASAFRELDIRHHPVLETAVSFYLRTGKAKSLSQFLEANSNLFQAILPEWREKIDTLARQLASDPSEKNRKSGFRLWKCMVNCLQAEAPPFAELVALLENETKNHLKSPIIQLIGLKTGIPAEDAMRVLLPYVSHLDENISGSAVKSIAAILLKSGTDLAPYAEALLEAILEPPVLVESVRKFGPVLSELVPAHNQLALELLERLLITCNTRIKNRSKRNLLNYFRVPARRVLHYAPRSSFDRFLQFVPELKAELGHIIVEAVCREAFTDMVPKLDALLEHPDVPGKVKELIRRHKYNRERTLGGEGWPELEELLSSGFNDTAAKDHAQVVLKKETSKKDQPDPDRENKNRGKKKILFLSANQAGDGRLSIDREFRAIDVAVGNSRNRLRLELIPKFAVSYEDFRQALLHHEPQIVHFSGHGTEDGLVVLDEGGIFPEMMSTEVVSRLFELFSKQIECVILSSCYSEEQAAVIVRHVPYVIGMSKEIEDNAAIEFSKGFYDALGAGWSIEDAFQLGVQGILQVFPELPQHLIPVLKKKESSP